MPFYGFYGYDSWFFAVILVMVIGMIAQARVTSTFKRYTKLRASAGKAARDVAQELLLSHGLDTQIKPVGGNLTDHFDPRNNTVGLSQAVYDDESVSALAVAAHEIGLVLQYDEGYVPIKIRNAILPVAQFGSTLSPWIVILGLFMGSFNLAMAGVCLFAAVFLFQLVTLPVEFNASSRGIQMLTAGGYINTSEEEAGARKVLRAAAMTYVVSALATLVSLFRLMSIAGRARRD